MADELSEFKREIGVKWVKAESGTSYLCPAAAYGRLTSPNEDDLKKICVDESDNPQND
ncbi:MAG: hypothetical protein JRI23_07350 [Deltaproteobacteria bacterium]|jgi:hypothetical protein|nr:hypothetical protein [Deltaproteobacteria bacterium]MBW2531409.1 hypothetical protein [Deltaproteobacteria bacterium]